MSSPGTIPGFYATPGLMSPGYITPGIPYEPSASHAGTLTLRTGVPYFNWLTGSAAT